MKIVKLSNEEAKYLLELINNSDKERFNVLTKKLKRKPIYMIFLYAINGRFGNLILKPKYRFWWRILTYSTITFLLFKFVACPFFDWWDKVVAWMNYIIWG